MDGLIVDKAMEVRRSLEGKAREVGRTEKGSQVTMEGHGRNMGGNNDSIRDSWAGLQ